MLGASGMTLTKRSLGWGFVAGDADPCLFTKLDKKGNVIRILLFVDDTTIFHDHGCPMFEELKSQLKSKYEFSDNEHNGIYDMTAAKTEQGFYHLGQQVHRRRATQVWHAGWQKRRLHGQVNPSQLDCRSANRGRPTPTQVAELIGVLRWIERCTRLISP